MEISNQLESLTVDFMVPAQYTDGAAAGTSLLAGDLPVFGLSISTRVPGDLTTDPPIWQGEF
jgi:hypothetical protein